MKSQRPFFFSILFRKMPLLNCLAAFLCLFTSHVMAQTTGDYKSKASGNWGDFTTWQVYNGSAWINAVAGQVPGGTSEADATNVYLEAAFTVTLTDDAACKNLNLNGAQDVIRINTGNFSLNIWGKMRTYTGVAPGTTDNTTTGSGIGGWITTGSGGRLKFRGTVNRVIFDVNEVSANSRSAGWKFDFAFDSGITGTCKTVIRCGDLIVSSGILDVMLISEGLTTDGEIRIAGNDYTAQPGNGTSGGTCIVKAGSTFKAYRLHKNTPTTVGNSLASFILEDGAILIAKQNCQIPALSYSINGEVHFESTTNQNFISNGGKVDGVAIVNYSKVVIGGTSTKTLVNNTSIVSKLTLGGTASIGAASFAIGYSTNATLEYNGSNAQTTTNTEFPAISGPDNLTINNTLGVNLHAARNLNGLLTLQAGLLDIGNNNFTLNENSPAVAGSPSISNMIITSGTGELRKIFNTPGNFFFPIGEKTGSAEYSYARVDVISADLLDATTYVGIRVIDADHPADNGVAIDNISRYWRVNSNISNISYDGIFQYLVTDINGIEANINCYNYVDETPLSAGSPITRVNSSLHRIVISGIASPGYVTGANFCSITNNNISYTGSTQFCGTSNLSSSILGDAAVVTSASPIYQWQQKVNIGSWNDLTTSANNKDYTETASLTGSNTYYYRREVSDLSNCLTSDANLSNEISVIVYSDISGNQIAADQIVADAMTTPNPFTESTSLAGGDGTYTYQWQTATSAGGPYIDILSENSPTYAPGPGVAFYIRKVQSSVCNTSSSNEVSISIVTSNEDNTLKESVKLYPNPAAELLNVEILDINKYEGMKIALVNSQGAKLVERDFGILSLIQLDLRTYAQGLYFLQLTQGSQSLATFKVVKK